MKVIYTLFRLCLILFLFISIEANSQCVVDLGADTTLCTGEIIGLHDLNPDPTATGYMWTFTPPGGAATPGPANYQFTSGVPGTFKVEVWVITPACPFGKYGLKNVTFVDSPAPSVDLGPDRTMCKDALGITLGPVNSPNYDPTIYDFEWSTGNTATTIAVNKAGKYWFKVFKGGCSSTDTIKVTVSSGPKISFNPNPPICFEGPQTLELVPQGGAVTYSWSTGESTPSITVSSEGTYTLDAFDVDGCKSTTSNVVRSICSAKLYVPNAFSPNGDGRNDVFQIFGRSLENYEIRIFNQWGELIFVSKDVNTSWDGSYRGKPVPQGSYVWKIEYESETEQGKEKKLEEGDVTIIN